MLIAIVEVIRLYKIVLKVDLLMIILLLNFVSWTFKFMINKMHNWHIVEKYNVYITTNFFNKYNNFSKSKLKNTHTKVKETLQIIMK